MYFKTLLACIASVIVMFCNGQNLLQSNQTPIYIGSNTFLRVDGDIYLNGSSILDNNGTVVTSGNYTLVNEPLSSNYRTFFYGPNEQIISSDSVVKFDVLLVDKSNELLLNQNIEVTEKVEITKGIVNLTNYNINLFNTGIILNEDEENFIYGDEGSIYSVTNYTEGSALVNSGNLGATLSSANTLGITSIERGHNFSILNDSPSVDKYYRITPVNNENLLNVLVLEYFENDLLSINIPESELAPYVSYDNGLTWTEIVGEHDMDANTFTMYNLKSLAMFTFAKSNPVLNINNTQLESVSVYPNPLTQGYYLEINGLESEMEITIISSQGQLVYKEHLTPLRKNTLDLNNLNPGSYFIQFNNLNTSFTKKLVKL